MPAINLADEPKGVDFSYNTLGQFTSIVRYTDLVQSPAPDVATSTFSGVEKGISPIN